MMVLRRVRSGPGRSASTPSRKPSKRRYYRRNPSVAGTNLADVGAAIAGGWATHQAASFASGFATPMTAWLDKFRAGLGQAGLSTTAALVVGWLGRKWHRHYGNVGQFGGLIVAGTQGASALTGMNPFEGQPAISGAGGFKALAAGKPDAAAPTRTDTTTGHQVFRGYARPVAEDQDVGL